MIAWCSGSRWPSGFVAICVSLGVTPMKFDRMAMIKELRRVVQRLGSPLEVMLA